MTQHRMPTNSTDPTSPRLFIDDQTGAISAESSVLVDPSGQASQGISADGAINIKAGTVEITKGTVANITIAAPKAGAQSIGGDDGRFLAIVNQSGLAHVITGPASSINNTLHILTMTAAVGTALLVAYGGKWFTIVSSGTVS